MLNDAILQELLHKYPVIHELPAPLQRAMIQNATFIKESPGSTFFDIDAPCRIFGLVLNGSIRVITPLTNERELVLYRVRPGQTCILTTGCLLGESPYLARGLVEGTLRGVAVPAPLFNDLIAGAPAFRRFVFSHFNLRVAQLIALIDAVGFRRLDERLARLLTMRGERIVTTHQMIADELGTVREVVSRILKQFEEDGWVQLSRGAITVINADELATLAASGDLSH